MARLDALAHTSHRCRPAIIRQEATAMFTRLVLYVYEAARCLREPLCLMGMRACPLTHTLGKSAAFRFEQTNKFLARERFEDALGSTLGSRTRSLTLNAPMAREPSASFHVVGVSQSTMSTAEG